MEITLLNKEKDMMEIQISGENETLLTPILHTLLLDDKVEFATIKRGHLYLEDPILIVKVNEGKPQMALKRAARVVANEFKEMKTKLDKASS